MQDRLDFINSGRPLKQKKVHLIPKKSPKRIEKEKQEKEARGGDDTQMEFWFKARRKNMVGVCQCGCGKPSQKKDDMYFRHSACHIFPKAKFESVMYDSLNFVERAFFGGCHSVMDDTSLDRWPNMADWEDVKEKFHQLAPKLTDQERATKFYHHLEKIIFGRNS